MIGDEPVVELLDLAGGVGRLPPADVLVYRLAGGRVVVRPSGTEPKLKAYLEVVTSPTEDDLAATRGAARQRLQRLRAALGRELMPEE